MLWKLKSEQLISLNQSGFREFRSTLDHLECINEEICTAFANNLHLILVSMDLKKAYEMVQISEVIQACIDMGLKGNIIVFITNFLRGRKIKVRINDQPSEYAEPENGLPTGSVMSVVLFIITINSILAKVKKPVKARLFADDLTLYCSGRVLDTTQKLVQEALYNVNNWAKENGFKFSTTKSTYTVFSRSNRECGPTTLLLDGRPLTRTSTTKILGMTFDHKHTWRDHIENFATECKKRLNIIKVLSATEWGADQQSLIRVYRGLIRAKIDYGSILYGSASSNLLKKLNSVQNAALRISLGVFRTTPVTSILAEAQEKPLELKRMELAITYASKIHASPTIPLNFALFHSTVNNAFQVHPRLPKPLKVRLRGYLSLLRAELIPVSTRTLHPNPPWTHQKISINMELLQYDRERTNSKVYRQHFMETKSRYGVRIFYYTDGSIMDEQAGCAIATELEDCESFRLPNQFTIYSCELYAILKILEIVKRSPTNQKVAICSDSYSSLTALRNYYTKNPLVQAIQVLTKELQERGTSLDFIWVPVHQGILGNERAGSLAKTATTTPIQSNNIPVTLPEAKSHNSEIIKKYWNNKWKSSRTHLQTVRADIYSVRPLIQSNRRDQCIITRLKSMHINASHIHHITKEEQKKCPLCGLYLTVFHILVECRCLSLPRKQFNIPGSISNILNSPDNCLKTLEFIKAINAAQFI